MSKIPALSLDRRADFEDFMRDEMRVDPMWLKRGPDGYYFDANVQIAWRAFLAGQRSLLDAMP